jgi:hypothetical protein
MKIFYASKLETVTIIELLGISHLLKYGTVDFFLSGNNSSLDIKIPVNYRWAAAYTTANAAVLTTECERM